MGKVLDDRTNGQGPKMTKINSKCDSRLDGFGFRELDTVFQGGTKGDLHYLVYPAIFYYHHLFWRDIFQHRCMHQEPLQDPKSAFEHPGEEW